MGKLQKGEGPDSVVDVSRYDRDIVPSRQKIDRLTLHLQFREHADERLQAVADLLFEEFAC